MAPPPRPSDAQMDAEVREKIHLEILKRTGAYHANDHVLLPSGHHTSEYIEKTLVTTEASFGGVQPKPPQGKVFVNPSRGVLLIASNLPRTPADKIYEMWIIPKAAKPVPAGLFQSQDDGNAMHVQPGMVDVSSTAAIAVTVENQAGADQPTTQPLIVAPLAAAPR